MSDDSSNEPSTLRSYIDSATGAVQNVVGSLTGDTGDQAVGQARQDKAKAEYDASQATVKLPGGAISSTGAFAKDDPNRTQGSWDQTSLKASGRQQNLEGQQREAKGQLRDYGHGLGDRVQRTVGGAVSGLAGDEEGQTHYEALHDRGKTQQRGAEHDIRKKAGGGQS
ncbi:hypothetical protein Trco_000835 [Trichoderma cornu-damae]|uniref:CsbD-like domain-containing protein n=1 Tax=Trichoderma cornu-damae TaxID=654480 RepID=A0A9P8QW52_9HYPO|nr:hypothetical protein Trco_000835 [Trichoderma cornu-damae]